jgi:signal transduction histidine kinase
MRVERSLRERNEALEEADRVKTEFLANVSYELRTPLTSVLGLSEVLLQNIAGELNQKQLYYVENIYKSSNQLMALINDILDLSTMGAGQLVLEVNEFDLCPVVEQMCSFIKEGYKDEAYAKIVVSCDTDVGVVLADEKRIRQVILGLLNNALKFTPPEGEIHVGVKAISRGEIKLWVEDNGVGIAADEQGKVFDQFHKTQWAWEQTKSGAGLGLSVAKSIIELHGGRIKLESEEGKGTKVICYLKRKNLALLDKK